MVHRIVDCCAEKGEKSGESLPIQVDAETGKWTGEIAAGERRYYFPAENDPEGEMSLRVFTLERTVHGSTSNGNGKPAKVAKPTKPRDDFPLFVHSGSGRWCRKVKWKKLEGREWKEFWKFFYYANVEDDPRGTESEEWYRHDEPYLNRCQEPPEFVPEAPEPDELTVRDACDLFLDEKDQLLREGNLSPRSYSDYRKTCERLRDLLGKYKLVEKLTPRDFQQVRFALSQKYGNVTLSNELTRMRSVFKFCWDHRLIPEPVQYGRAFDKPPKKAIRRDRNKKKRQDGLRMLEADEIRLILDALAGEEVVTKRIDEESGEPIKLKLKPNLPLRAMVLLGCNGGLGNSDLAEITLDDIDLETGWIDYPRPKTQVDREIPLWMETVEAVKLAIDARPKPKDRENGDKVFLTANGNKLVTINKNGNPNDELGKSFSRLLKKLGLKRKGLSFYCLRHNFETVAGGCKDQVAVSAIMGHADNSMSAEYRETIPEERLCMAVTTVREWLWPDADPWPNE